VSKDELRSLSKNDLVRLILRMQDRLAALEEQVAKSRKNSSTSSKPPSSDIVKPPKAKKSGSKKRKIGGQPGHEKHERRMLPAEKLDAQYDYMPACCTACGGVLKSSSHEPHVVQQVELAARSFEVTEHRAAWLWCPRCRAHECAQLPEVLRKSGLFGPRMRAFVAYLKGAGHMSYTTIQSLLTDVFGIRVSSGYLAKVVNRASAALAASYAQLRDALASQPWLNVDETGHKDNGKSHWVWCFRAPGFSVFRIDPSRGSCVLEDVLGQAYGGVMGADYFSAYRKYMGTGVLMQFCMAHLIRDVRYLTTMHNKVIKNYGDRVLKALKALFKILHRRDKMSAQHFAKRMEEAKQTVIRKALSAPSYSQPQNMARRFKQHGESYFRFMTTPGVEPTNNLAEQAIRHVVIDRRITQGTRGDNGMRWSERIWTVLATCAQQKRSAFDFINKAVHASIAGLPPPSLLPA
jgi:transposase